jgi:hypothetical protein
MKLLPGVAILPLLLAACATSVATEANADRTPPQAAALAEFQALQWVFREQHTTPQSFDFPGQGRVTVREISLDGFPGNTYVRCRFHFQNRAEKPIVQTWVSLDVLDAQGRLVASQASVCIVPHPIAIARGAFFADELRTQTFDAHLQPGWSWRIRCSSQMQEDDEPLDPPVVEPTLDPGVSKPLEIKDRGQRRWN